MNFVGFKYHKLDNVMSLNDLSREYHEITLCINGTLNYTVNGKAINLYEGDVVYVAPQDTRQRVSSKDYNHTFVSLNFISEKEKLFSSNFYKSIINENLMQIFELMERANLERNKDKILALIDYIIADIIAREGQHSENTTVFKIKDYIDSNVLKRLSVDDIANHVFLSKIYCENIFKKATGKTIVTYINNAKINVAKDYLLMSGLELTEISDKLGFTEYNYFSRLFKKVTGVSPLQFRKNKVNSR